MGKRLFEHNPVYRSKRNVAHHYDLATISTTCSSTHGASIPAPISCPRTTIWKLPRNRNCGTSHPKLLLKPGMRVLDVGCGWGGLAMYLAQIADVHVTGITLSQEQLKVAQDRARDAGLGRASNSACRTIASSPKCYDRIVSVGMFEHVGTNHYPQFFKKMRACLEEDGVALLHSIGRADGPSVTNQWIRKYIFPGGYSPALSEVLPAIERCRGTVRDRYRDPAPALRRDPEALAASAVGVPERRWPKSTTSVSVGCGSSICPPAKRCSGRGGHMVFQIQLARQSGRRSHDQGLHVRLGTGPGTHARSQAVGQDRLKRNRGRRTPALTGINVAARPIWNLPRRSPAHR